MSIKDIRYFRELKEESRMNESKTKGQETLKKELERLYPDAVIKDNYFNSKYDVGYFYGCIRNPIGLLITFPNQYGASIIRHSGSYGGRDGLIEMGVAIFSGELYGLCYDTPITSDVLGYLTMDELFEHLEEVSKLPSHCERGI